MKNKLLCTIPILFFLIHAQAQIGVEQYCYIENKKMTALVPIVNYERNHWYMEVRYNYEEMNTFSLYAGRTFSNEKDVHYKVTPMIGGVLGNFKGFSSGLNAVVEYKSVFFSTQSQHTMSFLESNADFFFAWSELGYQPWDWFFLGVTAQQTFMSEARTFESEPGLFVGFCAGMWTFPLYVFKPMTTGNYFVLGVNLGIDSFSRDR